jgi:N-acetylmuramoyl-L-alanine amidase
MAKYSIHAGHNSFVPGAQGFIKEEVVNRQIKNAVVNDLRAAGHTVYDDTDDQAKTQNENLAAIVRKINSHTNLSLVVSIHLNAGGGTGIEVYQPDIRTNEVAQRVLNAVCEVSGLKNRGTRINSSLYVLRNTTAPAILVECGFVDHQTDAAFVSTHTDAIGRAIAEGILGSTITSNKSRAASPKREAASSSVQAASLLQRGSHGSTVKVMQQNLIHAGYSVGSAGADGIFGAATEAAVRALQRDSGITVDGIVGQQTQLALSQALRGGLAVVPYPGHIIKRGSRGHDVERIQRALKLSVDGIFGPATEKAVKTYQRRHNLSVDGIVGPETWNTLF